MGGKKINKKFKEIVPTWGKKIGVKKKETKKEYPNCQQSDTYSLSTRSSAR